MARPSSAEALSREELQQLRHLSSTIDELLEESGRARESLTLTFRRLFPEVLALTGARAIAITTRDEDLIEQTWSEGTFGDGRFPGLVLSEHRFGVHRFGGDTLVVQPLDVVGVQVGTIGLLFAGDQTELSRAAELERRLDAIAEELDQVLSLVHQAAEKQQLLLTCNALLANPVFEIGMDQTVLALAQKERLPRFLLIYRDVLRDGALQYRLYLNGHLEHESGAQPHPGLEQVIAAHGPKLIGGELALLRPVTGEVRATDAVLIGGVHHGEPLGKIVVWGAPEGLSAHSHDVLRFLASTLSQRLVDYNRERTHLSQFFGDDVIDELLRDPRYASNYLTPREAEIGILFADINGFTRICELVLETPARIGRFVDRWSDGVVEILWKHGGVFDKMVGDCVIGLFGPPFFRDTPGARAEASVRAALEIQSFTEAMSTDPEVARLRERVDLPGLGVAIGVNLAHTYCGVFGPNQNYTGFSTGMNQTARLQSLGGFREVLLMEPVREALAKSTDPFFRSLAFGELVETPVKNVAQPLRHCTLTSAATRSR